MFASTNVFVAGPELGATPFVETVNEAEPATEPVQVAFATTCPAHCEVNVTDTCPPAFVFRLNGPAGTGQAPIGKNEIVTGSAAPVGCRPAPVSNSSVAV